MNQTIRPLERALPESQGVCSEGIVGFLDAVAQDPVRLHSIMLLRHGRVVAEGWWKPFGPNHRRYLYSLSKSFTSTAVGLAISEGLLNIDDRVVSFFPDDLPATISDNLAAMRVSDLLTMTTGHATDTTPALFTPGLVNWVQAILALPVDHAPGTHFVYNSGATYMLAAIVQSRTGRTLLDYLTERLLTPLGIVNATWEACPRGIHVGGWGMSITTEDIARFGQFCLQRGLWEGRQLVPATWIDAATSAQVPNDGVDRQQEPIDWQQGYGYQFWRCRHNAYRGDGAFGQYCIVMPEQDAVLAITSESPNMQVVLNRVWAHLLPAFEDDSLEAADEAATRLATLRLEPPGPRAAPADPGSWLGREFQMEPNQTGLRSIWVEDDGNGYRLSLKDEREEHTVRCGLDGWIENDSRMPLLLPTMMQLGHFGAYATPISLAAAAAWTASDTLTLTWQYLETPHRTTMTCQFGHEGLSLELNHSVLDPNSPFYAARELRFKGRPV